MILYKNTLFFLHLLIGLIDSALHLNIKKHQQKKDLLMLL